MATYESEITDFLRQLKQQRPHLEEEQRKGRAIWWDKRPRDLAERARMDEGRVPQAAYVYQGSE
jgi:IS5 family transposase